MKIYLAILFSLFLSAAYAQSPEYITYDQLEAKINKQDDTLRIINFWATWCKPCVEEIPAFEKLTKEYKNQKVKVILVSCDFRKQLDSRVIPFVNEKNIRSTVVFMNETDPNTWIERVDSKFSGAIPATLIINGKKDFRFFKEGETNYEELESIVKPLTQ